MQTVYVLHVVCFKEQIMVTYTGIAIEHSNFRV